MMTSTKEKETGQRRAAARKTALILAAIAIAIYVGFIFSAGK
ncbi:hypothetical protein [Solemya elarraichensis gill symbiont]|nr:hypothetical protein [Solemya elarraichensis gill symbiont]